MGKAGARKTMMAVALCLLLPKLLVDVALVVALRGRA
jgi:hypothetical protein